MPHTPPSFCNKGLLLLHVPANLPSFFTRILIAIPANASATSTTVINITVIFKCTKFSTKELLYIYLESPKEYNVNSPECSPAIRNMQKREIPKGQYIHPFSVALLVSFNHRSHQWLCILTPFGLACRQYLKMCKGKSEGLQCE